MSVTLLDIAKAAGVAPSTVSRVLNNSPHPISFETKQLVRNKAQQLGYKPNMYARSLATQNVRILEVFLDLSFDEAGETGAGSYVTQALCAAQRVSEASGYKIVVDIAHAISDTSDSLSIASMPIAGGLVFSPRKDDPHVAWLASQHLPFVVLGSTDFKTFSYVDIDNVAGATLAVEHLADMGHRKIACLGGPSNYQPSLERIAGYRRVLRSRGLVENKKWVRAGEWTWENGCAMMEKVLQAPGPPPTAVFACNDMLAMGAMRAIKARGLRIPHDISIVGFDDQPVSLLTDPALTTVNAMFADLASMATQRLLEQIESGESADPPYQELVIPKLVIRNSVACPAE